MAGEEKYLQHAQKLIGSNEKIKIDLEASISWRSIEARAIKGENSKTEPFISQQVIWIS